MLEWLFRPQCAACGVLSTDPLCAACALSLVELGDACALCAQPGRSPCRRCAHEPLPLERIVAAWRFGGSLAIAIRRLKFTGATHVARTVAPLWAPLLAAAIAETDGIIVPVPLHWRRRLRRGFDQTCSRQRRRARYRRSIAPRMSRARSRFAHRSRDAR